MTTRVMCIGAAADQYGSDEMLLRIARHIDARPGIEVTVVLPEEGPLTPALAGTNHVLCEMVVLRKTELRTLHGVVKFAVGLPFALLRAARLLRRARPDLVWVNTITVPYWILIARALRIPVVCHCHELVGGSRVARWLLYAGIRMSTRTVAVSDAVRDDILAAYPSCQGRVVTIQNAAFEFPDGLAIREGHEHDLVVVGRLSPRKGQDLVLRAAQAIHACGASVHLCGETFPGYEEYEALLRELAARSALPIFFHGFVDKSTAFSLGGIVVVPSPLPDPCPLVVLEALAAGRLVIGAASGGIPGTIGDAGIVVPRGDEHALADAIERALALEADELRARFHTARRRAWELSPDAFFPEIDDVVDDIIAVPRAAGVR